MSSIYLTETQIRAAAEYCANAYEFNSNWRAMGEAAREYVADEIGARATKAQVATIIRHAQLIEHARKIAAKDATC